MKINTDMHRVQKGKDKFGCFLLKYANKSFVGFVNGIPQTSEMGLPTFRGNTFLSLQSCFVCDLK